MTKSDIQFRPSAPTSFDGFIFEELDKIELSFQIASAWDSFVRLVYSQRSYSGFSCLQPKLNAIYLGECELPNVAIYEKVQRFIESIRQVWRFDGAVHGRIVAPSHAV